MKEFVFMQGPYVPVPGKSNKWYFTIGLRDAYPGRGYNGCDEYGIMNSSFPEEDKPLIKYFPFADEESKKYFKGEVITKDGLEFAVVKHHPSQEAT